MYLSALPVLQSPDGTPEHPLSSTSSIAVGVEEGHCGTAVSCPPSVPVALKPQTHCQHQQNQNSDQQNTQKHQGQQQLPQ